jgi:hypothetical protein
MSDSEIDVNRVKKQLSIDQPSKLQSKSYIHSHI